MTLLLKISLGLLLPFLAGYSVIALLFKNGKPAKSFQAALSYGLGMGILTQVMFLYGVLKIPFNLYALAAPLLFISLTALTAKSVKRLNRKRFLSLSSASRSDQKDALASAVKQTPISRLFLPDPRQQSAGENFLYGSSFLLLAFYTVFVFWRALHLPIFEWDAFAFISYKAKIFFYTQGLPPLIQLPHSSYPLHVPFMETWIALAVGSWDDQLIKIIFPLAFLSYLVIHYHALATFLPNRSWAMLGTALLVTSHQFVFYGTVAYREIFMVLYNNSTILLLLLWQRKRQETGYLLLAGLFAGLAAFTKLEGMAYWLVYFVLLWLMTTDQGIGNKNRWANIARFIIASLLLFLPFLLFKVLSQTPSSEKTHLHYPGDIFGQLFSLLGSFSHYLFLSGNWNILWFLLVLSLPKFLLAKQRRETVLVGWAIILFFVLYLGIGLTTTSVKYLVGAIAIDAVPRIILHFFPLCPLLLILLNTPNANTEKKLNSPE